MITKSKIIKLCNTTTYLESDNIFLREVCMADVNKDYEQWLNDPQVNQFLETRFSRQSKENISNFVHEKINSHDEILLAICDTQSKSHIGNIKLGPVNWHHLSGEISLFIGNKSYWGKGIASQAIKLISELAFNQYHLNKLSAGAYKKNVGSIKAFQRCGYNIEGEIEDAVLVNNIGMSVIKLGITAKQFRAYDS